MPDRFQNLEPPFHPPEIKRVLRWAVVDKVMGRRRRSPSRVPVPVVEPALERLASADPSLTWVGHATWLIRLAGRTLVTDPVWSERLGPGLRRNVPPGVPLEQAQPEVVLVSHNHRDHLDAPTIRRIGKRARYVVPKGMAGFFTRWDLEVDELEWWQPLDLGDGLEVTFVPSQHWSQRGPTDKNASLWGGFVVSGQGKRVYFAGDTAYFGGFADIGERLGPIDAALLPIGAYDPEWFMRHQHMNPEDAMRAFQDLGARLFCAMHWGTFKLTDEPLDEPPERLEAERARVGVAAERVWVAAIGESRGL